MLLTTEYPSQEGFFCGNVTLMPETFVSSSQMLHDAVTEYQYFTPEGDFVWCPYIVNGGRRLPNPSTDFLKR